MCPTDHVGALAILGLEWRQLLAAFLSLPTLSLILHKLL